MKPAITEPKATEPVKAMPPTAELPKFEPLLNSQQAAALLGIHPKTLQ